MTETATIARLPPDCICLHDDLTASDAVNGYYAILFAFGLVNRLIPNTPWQDAYESAKHFMWFVPSLWRLRIVDSEGEAMRWRHTGMPTLGISPLAPTPRLDVPGGERSVTISDQLFDTLVAEHAQVVLNVATAFVGAADAEDAGQEAIVRAWQA
jgi:hypothetical protein